MNLRNIFLVMLLMASALFPLNGMCRATHFKFHTSGVDFFRKSWSITSLEICNVDHDGRAGALDLQFQLQAGKQNIHVGSKIVKSPPFPGNCITYTNLRIPVNLNKVPRHQVYSIFLDIAEKNRGKWLTVDVVTLNKDYFRK